MKLEDDLLKMIGELPDLSSLKDFLQKEVRVLDKDAPGSDIALSIQSVINGNEDAVYLNKPYLATTENQRLIGKVLPPITKQVGSILGSVDNVFECVAEGVGKIHVWDINRLQVAVYHLKRASILALSPKEYDQFLVDYTSKRFLSNDVFQTVKPAISDECYQNAWDAIFGMNPQEDLKNYLFKGVGIDLTKLRYGMPYLKNKSRYYRVKEQLPKADITVSNGDIVSGILSSSETFDFIHLSNFLLFAYQLECDSSKELFRSKIKQLREIYDKHLNPGGAMLLDYWFGAKPETLNQYSLSAETEELTRKIYQCTYDLLNQEFDLETCQVERVITGLPDSQDTVIYTKKRK